MDRARAAHLITAGLAGNEADEGEDVSQIEASTQTLTDALHKMSEEIYRKASAQQSADGAAGAQDDETVEDAEYEIVDDEPSPHA